MQDSALQWDLELWGNDNGSCPVAEFFDELRLKKKVEYERMFKRLKLFQESTLTTLRQTQHISKVVNEDFWEVRLRVGIEIRLLGKIIEKQGRDVFIAVHGFHKKDQKIRKSDIEIARERLRIIS